jgi:hypothetical protein
MGSVAIQDWLLLVSHRGRGTKPTGLVFVAVSITLRKILQMHDVRITQP